MSKYFSFTIALLAIQNDLLAADKAGFKTIFIRRESEYGKYFDKFEEQSFEANLSISSLEDLKEVVI